MIRLETIHEDKEKVVKAAFYKDEFFYTVTYILNNEGGVIKQINVYLDGEVSIWEATT